MAESQLSIFDIILLVVGIAASVLGFQLISNAYHNEGANISWLMIISIFTWLTLLVMFILLSVMVDVSKKQLNEIKTIISIMSKGRKKK